VYATWVVLLVVASLASTVLVRGALRVVNGPPIEPQQRAWFTDPKFVAPGVYPGQPLSVTVATVHTGTLSWRATNDGKVLSAGQVATHAGGQVTFVISTTGSRRYSWFQIDLSGQPIGLRSWIL